MSTEESHDFVDTTRFRIPILKDDNYFTWCHKMEFVLRSKGLWDIVNGTETAPTTTAELPSFRRRRDTALSHIIITIDDSCSAAVITLRDPKEVWNTLKEMYKAVSEARVDAYLAHFQLMKMDPSETVMSYANRLTNMVNKLAAVGHSIPESDKKRVLLRGLREEYSVTVGVVRVTRKKFSEAIADLTTQEAELQAAGALQTADSSPALIGSADMKCGYCRKKGHNIQNSLFNPAGPNYKPKLAQRRKVRMSKNGKKYGNGNGISPKEEKNAVVDVSFFPMQDSEKDEKSKWYIDSGASSHMCNNPNYFTHLDTDVEPMTVSVGDGTKSAVVGKGTIVCEAEVNGSKRLIGLHNVLCVPDLMCNLLSVSRIRKATLRVVFDDHEDGNGQCEISGKNTGDVYLRGVEQKNNGLYRALMKPLPKKEIGHLVAKESNEHTWHRRLGHVSIGTMKSSMPLVTGLSLPRLNSLPTCEPCQLAKSKRAPRPQLKGYFRRATRPLDLVHVDIVGPIRQPSLRGSIYFMPLYDDASCLSLVRLMRFKSHASGLIKDMMNELETVFQGKVKSLKIRSLRSDNAKKFLSPEFENWMKRRGTTHEP